MLGFLKDMAPSSGHLWNYSSRKKNEMTERPTLASVSDSIIQNMDAKEVSGHDTKNKCKKKSGVIFGSLNISLLMGWECPL